MVISSRKFFKAARYRYIIPIFFSDNHDNRLKALTWLNAPEIFGSTFTHYLTIAFKNVIYDFYAVSSKNNCKYNGSVFIHILR